MRTLNTYADDNIGKISENLLRRIVTGKGTQALRNTEGLQGKALQHAPKPEDIKRDISRLKVLYLRESGSGGKKLVPMTKRNKFKALKERIKAIGYTARTLLFNWDEAVSGQRKQITGELTRNHEVIIETVGKLQKATFKSKHDGLIYMDKKHGIIKEEVEKAKADAIPYLQSFLQKELKDILK